jgi:hypothetical protein
MILNRWAGASPSIVIVASLLNGSIAGMTERDWSKIRASVALLVVASESTS